MKEKVTSIIFNIYIVMPLLLTVLIKKNIITVNQSYNYLYSYFLFLGVMIFFLFISQYLENKNSFLKKYKAHLIVFLPFLTACILSTANSSIIELSVYGRSFRRVGLVSVIVFLLLLIYSSNRTKKSNLKSLYLFSISGGFLAIIFFSESFFSQILIPHFSYFYHYNHYAYFFLLVSFSIIFTYFNIKEIHKKIFFLFLYCIVLFSLFKSNTLGTFLSFYLTFFIFIFYSYIKKDKFEKMFFLFIISIIVLMLSTINGSLVLLEFKRFIFDLLNLQQDKVNFISSNNGRLDLWMASIKGIIEKPFFGHGLDNLNMLFFRHGIYGKDLPHNEFLQYFAGIGILGGILYVQVIMYPFIKFIKNRKNINFKNASIIMIVTSYLISSFFGVAIFYTTSYFFIVLGFSINLLEGSEQNE